MTPERPDPWPGFDTPGTSPCWVHYCNERIPRNVFVVCFECGHVWTRWTLWRAWVRSGKESARWNREHPPPFGIKPPSRLRDWAHRWFKRPSRIFFCQACIHDF